MSDNSAIYIVGPEKGPHKIGVTNNIRGRLTGLQNGNPYRLIVKELWNIPDSFLLRVEHTAHCILNEHRLVGEWFDVTAEVAKSAVLIAVDRLGGVTTDPEALKLRAPIPKIEHPFVPCPWEQSILEFGFERLKADLYRLAPPTDPNAKFPRLSDWIIEKTRHMGVRDGAAWVGLAEDEFAERVSRLRRQEEKELIDE